LKFSRKAAWSERESIEEGDEDRVIAELERGDGEPKKGVILDCRSQCMPGGSLLAAGRMAFEKRGRRMGMKLSVSIKVSGPDVVKLNK